MIAAGETGSRANSKQNPQIIAAFFTLHSYSHLASLAELLLRFLVGREGNRTRASSELGDWCTNSLDWQTISLFLGRCSPNFAVAG